MMSASPDVSFEDYVALSGEGDGPTRNDDALRDRHESLDPDLRCLERAHPARACALRNVWSDGRARGRSHLGGRSTASVGRDPDGASATAAARLCATTAAAGISAGSGISAAPPQNFAQQAGQAANALGNATVAGFGALGSAFSSLGNAVAGYTPGARCLVTWSDGQRYPATVVQTAQGQVLVAMSDGRQLWLPQAYVVVQWEKAVQPFQAQRAGAILERVVIPRFAP